MNAGRVSGALLLVISTGCRSTTTASAPENVAPTEVGATTAASERRSAPDQESAKGGPGVALTLLQGPHASNVPIRTGVPFPSGALTSPAQLRLEDADGGAVVPAQFDVLAKWPDASIKAVLVQFVGNLGPAKHYRLVFGAAVSANPPPRAIGITRAGARVTVDTGPLRFSIDSKGVLDALWRR